MSLFCPTVDLPIFFRSSVGQKEEQKHLRNSVSCNLFCFGIPFILLPPYALRYNLWCAQASYLSPILFFYIKILDLVIASLLVCWFCRPTAFWMWSSHIIPSDSYLSFEPNGQKSVIEATCISNYSLSCWKHLQTSTKQNIATVMLPLSI